MGNRQPLFYSWRLAPLKCLMLSPLFFVTMGFIFARHSAIPLAINMNNSETYIAAQPAERQQLLTSLHELIMQCDTTVTPVVEPMMGKEMIVYKDRGMMKYALSSVKNYMSLHVLPMYGSEPLYTKYKALLPQASFQKGCINFTNAADMPLDIIKQLLTDCAPIDLIKLREAQLAERKQQKAKK